MGNVYAYIEVLASDGSYSRSLRMQADTGCLYSQLPHGVLVEMGWAADLPSLDHFVFGEDECLPLLGVRTMEELGLGVDLVNHRLIQIAAEV